MSRHVVSPAAERDIQSILTWTHEQFGPQARSRYETLLARAILDVFENPDRPGSHVRPEIARAARTYHLQHSRDRIELAADRVRHPRHLLLFRVREDGSVEIGRVLHDCMELARHLPEDFSSSPPGQPPTMSP